ncbi:MAG TPA: DUF5658 family protein [Limnochorda sp.]
MSYLRLMVLFQLADLAVTLYAVSRGFREVNVVARSALEAGGPVGLVVFKLALVLWMSAVILRFMRTRIEWAWLTVRFGCAVGAVVLAWNGLNLALG